MEEKVTGAIVIFPLDIAYTRLYPLPCKPLFSKLQYHPCMMSHASFLRLSQNTSNLDRDVRWKRVTGAVVTLLSDVSCSNGGLNGRLSACTMYRAADGTTNYYDDDWITTSDSTLAVPEERLNLTSRRALKFRERDNRRAP